MKSSTPKGYLSLTDLDLDDRDDILTMSSPRVDFGSFTVIHYSSDHRRYARRVFDPVMPAWDVRQEIHHKEWVFRMFQQIRKMGYAITPAEVEQLWRNEHLRSKNACQFCDSHRKATPLDYEWKPYAVLMAEAANSAKHADITAKEMGQLYDSVLGALVAYGSSTVHELAYYVGHDTQVSTVASICTKLKKDRWLKPSMIKRSSEQFEVVCFCRSKVRMGVLEFTDEAEAEMAM